MTETPGNIALNRYPGVKPFSVSESYLFFGRETDISALNSLLFVKQSVVLYGKSGYGKSSLINAGIIPRLKENKSWAYFFIRFNNFSEKENDQNLSPSQTLKQRLAANITVAKDNILDSLILNEDSFWYWIKQNQLITKNTNFIIFFDQFEELFTYPKEQIADFSEQLSQLLYTTLPVTFKKRLAVMENSNAISNEQHDFLYEKPEIKVMFSIRSDRLSLMNVLTDRHPSILQNCYELDALNNKDARKAIMEPAKLPKELGFSTTEFNFTDEAVDKILTNIANPQDGKIEASTLQIVCRFVEDNLVGTKVNPTITDADLGDITGIFQQYYEGVLDKLTENEKVQAQKLIEDELIDGGKRNPLSATYIKTKFGLSANLLLQLENSSLLRKERDAAGRILYEVSHDSLVNAIEKVANDRRNKEESLKKRELEEQVIEERKRAVALALLNKKAVYRYKLAIGLVVLSLALTSIAGYLWKQSADAAKEARKQEKIANDNLKLAETEKNNAIRSARLAEERRIIADSAKQEASNMKTISAQSLYEMKKMSAIFYLGRGDAYITEFGDNEISLNQAMISYDSAMFYLNDYKGDTLYKIISNKIRECKRKLK